MFCLHSSLNVSRETFSQLRCISRPSPFHHQSSSPSNCRCGIFEPTHRSTVNFLARPSRRRGDSQLTHWPSVFPQRTETPGVVPYLTAYLSDESTMPILLSPSVSSSGLTTSKAAFDCTATPLALLLPRVIKAVSRETDETS